MALTSKQLADLEKLVNRKASLEKNTKTVRGGPQGGKELAEIEPIVQETFGTLDLEELDVIALTLLERVKQIESEENGLSVRLHLAHQIRLYPTVEQEQYFKLACGVSRFACNWALNEWKNRYEAGIKTNEGRTS